MEIYEKNNLRNLLSFVVLNNITEKLLKASTLQKCVDCGIFRL